jgi:isopenicillin-N N-acyltransferase-like protein
VTSTKETRRIKVVDVSGNPYEMGFQYGTACPEIGKMLEYTYQMLGGRDAATALAEKYLPMYLPPTEAYAPEVVDEMKGIAAGVKADFQDILLLNITYEISATLTMGCTSFAAGREATGDGNVLTGQNFDFLRMMEEVMILLKMKPAQGPNILAITTAGCLGLIGLNSAGISLNLNMLRNKDSLTPDGGVLSHVILRKLLSTENVGEAIGIITAAERRSAKNYLLASDRGDIVDVEVTMDDLNVHSPERGILTHANHFETARFKSADIASAMFPDSYVRSHRLAKLMEKDRGNLSVDIMKRLLQDHNNHPSSICRHPDPKATIPIAGMMKTLLSIISCPKEQKVYIALGNPCENEYMEYKL